MDKLNHENKFAIMPEWVIELDISHTAFRLYAVLARYADNVTHQAFPSLDTLADRLSCSEKTVRRAIEDLVKHGAITKHNRGRYHSNLYTVMTTNPNGTKMSSEWTNMSDEGTKMSQRVDKNDQVTITNELEPKELEPLNSEFDQFWAVYPIKKDKPLARRSFAKALKRASFEVIIQGAMRYRDDLNREDRYTKNPSTWLNVDGWENPPEVPRNATRQKPMTNNEQAALLAMQYRQQAKELESGGNPAVAQEVEMEATNWLKGTDDL